MGKQRLMVWQLRDIIRKKTRKLSQDWNHNLYGFGDGPVGEYIPYDNISLARHRAQVGYSFLQDKRFNRFLYSSQPVEYLFSFIDRLIKKEELEEAKGIQVSLFENADEAQARSEEKNKALEADLVFLKEVREMIRSPEAFFGSVYRA